MCDGRRRTEIGKLGSILNSRPQSAKKSNAQKNQNLIWLCKYLFKMLFLLDIFWAGWFWVVVLAQNMVCFGSRTLLCIQTDFWQDGFWEVVLGKQLFLSACALCCASRRWSVWFWAFVVGQKQFTSVRVLRCVYRLQSPDTSLVFWSTYRTLPQSAAELSWVEPLIPIFFLFSRVFEKFSQLWATKLSPLDFFVPIKCQVNGD